MRRVDSIIEPTRKRPRDSSFLSKP